VSDVVVTIAIHGIPVPVTLDDAALAVIAEAISTNEQPREEWPEWMSIATAARYLDVGVERLRKLVAGRAIPFVQEAPACRIFFSRSELDGWMRGFQQTGSG
jgi:excisionase family DNA binding protein